MEKILCRQCHGEMKEGLVLIPIWGRTNGGRVYRGDTLNVVAHRLGPCMKCPDCGHSFADYLVQTRTFRGETLVVNMTKDPLFIYDDDIPPAIRFVS